uniref:SprB repeat-containing protein n=1 Tax=Tenacibaculum ovolyticum TaxID=104270 RepID=UPI0005BA92D8
ITLDPVVLSDPSPIVVAATVTKDITCDADPSLDGATITITATTSGGNGAAYTYELFDNATATGAAVQVGAPFTDIDIAGDYWVVAIDVESCRSTPVLVNVPVRETIVFTAVPQCYDGANGVIDINITSGNGTYEFSLDGTTWQTPTPANATSFSITGLSNIAYTVEIRDIKGCTQTENVTINNALVATATPTNASCIPLGTPTGQIEVFPTGGSTTGYEFSVVTDGSTAGVFSATNPITNLAAGTYDVYVRDDVNCEFIIQDVVIEQITPVAITITDNQPTCNGDTGSIDGVINANTGQSPHTITIADSGGVIAIRTLTAFIGTNFSFNNLPAETYTIEITDDLGCTDSQSVTLVDPPALTISIVPERPICGTPFALGTNETLFGYDFTGFPTILAPNKLQFSVDNGVTWQDSPIFRGTDGSPDFNYGTVTFPAIRITDIATESITYCFNSIGSYTMPFEVSPLVVNVTTNSADCTAGAEAVVNVSGGVGNYQYTYNTIQVAPGPSGWQPAGLGTAATTYTFSGLTPGRTYYFFVKDLGDNDCVKVDDTFIIDIDVVITPSILSQSCNGGNTGSLQFDIDDTTSNLLTGGVPAINWELFSLNVVTGVSTSVETGTQGSLAPILPTGNGTLSPGTYYLEIENNAGTCTFASPNIEILETAPINANLTVVSDITCSTNGVIRVNATGGTGPYTYSVASSVNFLPADATVSGTTIEFAYADVTDPTLDVTGINITITDSNGNSCSTTVGPESLIVGQLPNIISSTPNSCGVNKTITTRVNSGTGPYQFSVDAGAFSSSIALDGGLGYAEFIAENLTPGNHIITIRDANGCTVTTNSDIQQSLEYTVTSTKNLTCDTPSPADEATYDVNVTSGSGAYTYEITGTVSGVVITAGTALPSNPFTFSTAVAEDYTIIITDTAETPNCTLTKTFEVKAALQPVFTTNVVDATCNGGANGSIGVSVTTGLTPYTYSIVQTAG